MKAHSAALPRRGWAVGTDTILRVVCAKWLSVPCWRWRPGTPAHSTECRGGGNGDSPQRPRQTGDGPHFRLAPRAFMNNAGQLLTSPVVMLSEAKHLAGFPSPCEPYCAHILGRGIQAGERRRWPSSPRSGRTARRPARQSVTCERAVLCRPFGGERRDGPPDVPETWAKRSPRGGRRVARDVSEIHPCERGARGEAAVAIVRRPASLRVTR